MTVPTLPISLADIESALTSIQPFLRRTPVIHSDWLSELARAEVYLKLENLQVTRSFKARGALYKLLRMAERGETGQVLAVSAGNHGQGLAWAARLLGFAATVVVPVEAPRAKVEAIRRRGAELRVMGRDYDEAELLARQLARESGVAFVSPYNDLEVVCGQGTVALELFAEVPALDLVVAPVGGGGLLAGVGVATKGLRPSARVLGVQAQNSCAMYEALRSGGIVRVADKPTIADGLAGNVETGSCTFPLIQATTEQIALVSEDELKQAIVAALKYEGLVLEGAGAAAVAALMAGKVEADGQKVGLVLSGGNIDLSRLIKLASDLA